MFFLKKMKLGLYYLKQWSRALYIYPKNILDNKDYENYWESRKIQERTGLNSFQRKRAGFAVGFLEEGSVIMDIGCGNGAVLTYINEQKPMKKLIGVDISKRALEIAGQKGAETILLDISKESNWDRLPSADYIFLFEVIEHLSNSEEILKKSLSLAKKGIFFSVPNTGFFTHRLRLLFGRFPLQWKVSPSEHLRFWTVRDIKWWLKKIGFKNYILKSYEGVPLLNKIWPSFFGQGIWVFIPIVR